MNSKTLKIDLIDKINILIDVNIKNCYSCKDQNVLKNTILKLHQIKYKINNNHFDDIKKEDLLKYANNVLRCYNDLNISFLYKNNYNNLFNSYKAFYNFKEPRPAAPRPAARPRPKRYY